MCYSQISTDVLYQKNEKRGIIMLSKKTIKILNEVKEDEWATRTNKDIGAEYFLHHETVSKYRKLKNIKKLK